MQLLGLDGALFYFFQAEVGIRDYKVTGVQTCALPISKIKSSPSPPTSMSAPWLPTITSLPAPPSSVRLTTPAGRLAAVMLSWPSNPLTISASDRKSVG